MELIINIAIKEQMDKHDPNSEIYDVLSCALETIKDRDVKLANRDKIESGMVREIELRDVQIRQLNIQLGIGFMN